MATPDESTHTPSRYLQAIELATKSVIPGVVVLALCLLLLFPVSWVQTIASHVTDRLHALGVELKTSEFSVGPLKFGINPRADVLNVAALQGAESLVQQALATPDPLEARRQLTTLAGDLASRSQQLKEAQAQKAREVAKVAKPAAGSTPLVAWVYVGRLNSSGRWAPVSDDVIPDPRGGKPQTVALKANTMLLATLADTGDQAPSGPLQMVRNDTQLPVIEVRQEDSIGGGKLVWAKVSVPADNVLEVARR